MRHPAIACLKKNSGGADVVDDTLADFRACIVGGREPAKQAAFGHTAVSDGDVAEPMLQAHILDRPGSQTGKRRTITGPSFDAETRRSKNLEEF